MLKKQKGTIVVAATVIFTITTILILVVYSVTLNIIQDEAEMSSDDLVSSELAVYKDIDLRVLGESKELNLLIFKYDDSNKDLNLKYYFTFLDYLKKNFNLNDNMEPVNNFNFIKSKVKVDVFTIYNVIGQDVEILDYKNRAEKIECVYSKVIDGRNKVTTPKGTEIENTTIYSRISFDIEGLFKNKKNVTLDEETDILKE